MVRGLSVLEISRSLDPPVDVRTVQRDILAIKSANREWWKQNSGIKARMINYLKETIDALREVIREAWLIHYNAEDARPKIAALKVIIRAEMSLAELLGISGMSLLTQEVMDKMEEVDSEIAELRKLAGSRDDAISTF